ncbi:hypothetical protein THAOC_05801 [Thalassiosira oceanica]|uniref:Uncharacterized protein n=1 Tax=Thalassiosira oceanica TaxID=159749 RepID=K0T6G4_THAOC|nr:hypothetical protein THAOC_05801 [Thalassiosira oceanica]|eukprot:EJK72649.1 hypothetical protein THAOC_05801 [Thalassiosira oceanica]
MIEVPTEWPFGSPRPEDHGTGPRTAREGAHKACFHRKFYSSLRQKLPLVALAAAEAGASKTLKINGAPAGGVAASPTAGGGRSRRRTHGGGGRPGTASSVRGLASFVRHPLPRRPAWLPLPSFYRPALRASGGRPYEQAGGARTRPPHPALGPNCLARRVGGGDGWRAHCKKLNVMGREEPCDMKSAALRGSATHPTVKGGLTSQGGRTTHVGGYPDEESGAWAYLRYLPIGQSST